MSTRRAVGIVPSEDVMIHRHVTDISILSKRLFLKISIYFLPVISADCSKNIFLINNIKINAVAPIGISLFLFEFKF